MTVREDEIRRPDGSTGIYGVIDKPAYALVIAQDGWEFPQGTAPGMAEVPPAELAARELREETGLRAGSMVPLGKLDVAPGLSSQRGWVFLATDITEGEPEREHEEQDMRSAWFSRADVEKMILADEITDAQSIAAWGRLMLAERHRP